MLHSGMLPNHGTWPAPWWRTLSCVVLDEAHHYSGIFGCHTALVLRRLIRLLHSYGNVKFLFLCLSATIGNPREHVLRLTSVEPVCITVSGAPNGRKALVLWQPPEASEQAQRIHANESGKPQRKSAYQETGEVVRELVSGGLRPLVFVPARKLTEIVAASAQSELRKHHIGGKCESYRAGYSAADRRALEAQLMNGTVSCLISTSALELGIDVGELDATVHLGVPETASAQWQQAGRAGRRSGEASVAIVVATERPLDLLYLSQPELLSARKPEAANVDPANPALLTLHVAAAAFEQPLTVEDTPLFGGSDVFSAALRRAVELRLIEFVPAMRMYRCLVDACAQGISIRSSLSREVVELHDQSKLVRGQLSAASLVEKIDKQHIHYKVHVGALFFHRDSVFEVRTLDLTAAHYSGPDVAAGANEGRGVAIGVRREGECGEVTTAADSTLPRVLSTQRQRSAGAAPIFLGRLHIDSYVTGWTKKNIASNKVTHREENLPQGGDPNPGYKALDLDTDGCWLEIPPEVVSRLQPSGELMSAAHGVKNVMLALIPSMVACDAGDVCVTLVGMSDEILSPTLYIWDMYGGVGLCSKIFEGMEKLLADAAKVMDRCPCPKGCASCTHSSRAGVDKKADESKAASKVIVQSLLGAWMMAPGTEVDDDEPRAGAADDEYY